MRKILLVLPRTWFFAITTKVSNCIAVSITEFGNIGRSLTTRAKIGTTNRSGQAHFSHILKTSSINGHTLGATSRSSPDCRIQSRPIHGAYQGAIRLQFSKSKQMQVNVQIHTGYLCAYIHVIYVHKLYTFANTIELRACL